MSLETVQFGSRDGEGRRGGAHMISLVWELGGDRIVSGEHQTENPVSYKWLPTTLVPKWKPYRKQCPVLMPDQQGQNPWEWGATAQPFSR